MESQKTGLTEHPRRNQNQVVPRLAVVEFRQPSARVFGWFPGGDELPEINLLEALLARSLQWYLPHMLRCRVRHARDNSSSCQAVVMDGNCKLSPQHLRQGRG